MDPLDPIWWIEEPDGTVRPAKSLQEGAAWFETADRQTAETFVGTTRVSTVFLGLDHRFGGAGSPVLYETMIFGGPLDSEQHRYCTRAQALEGHAFEVARVRLAQTPPAKRWTDPF